MPRNPDQRDPRVEDLLDRDEIAHVLIRYATGLDNRDAQAVASCFTDDARFDFSGGTVGPGVEQVVSHVMRVSTLATTTHMLGNLTIHVSGTTAEAHTSAVAYLLLNSEPRLRVRGLRYDDKLLNTAVGWRIHHRRHSFKWMYEVPTTSEDRPLAPSLSREG
jgi:hypothetical protein